MPSKRKHRGKGTHKKKTPVRRAGHSKSIRHSVIRPKPTHRSNTKRPKSSSTTKIEPSAIAQPTDTLTRLEQSHTIAQCLLVIIGLWSIEVPQAMIEAWKLMVLKGKILGSSDSQEFDLDPVSQCILICATCLVVFLLSLFIREYPYKCWVAIAGLYVHSCTTLAGLLLVITQSDLFHVLIRVLDVGWQAAAPLRFFLIFHLVFPIRVFQTRLLTSFNEFMIGAAEYFSLVFIVQTNGFTRKTYTVGWILMLVIILGWIVWIQLVKKYIRETPLKTDEIQSIYRNSGVESSFQHRNCFKNTVLFVLILIPSGIFPVLTTTLTMDVQQYSEYFFFRYRFDVLVALAITGFLEMILDAFKESRDEMEDLWAIGLAHFVNIVSLLALLIVTPHLPSASRSASKVGLLVLFHPMIWNDKLKIKIDGQKPLKQTWKNRHVVVWLSIANSRQVNLEGFVDDELMFEGNVRVATSASKFYKVLGKNEDVIPISWPVPNNIAPGANWVVFNLLDFCSIQGVIYKFEVDGECVQVKLRVSQYKSSNYFDIIWVANIPVPNTFEATNTYTSAPLFPSNVSYVRVQIILNDRTIYEMNVSLVDNSSTTFFIVRRNNSLQIDTTGWIENLHHEEFPFDHSNRAYRLLSISALAGLSLGISEVSYIHFAWILAPYDNRTPILAIYFILRYVSKEAADLYFDHFKKVSRSLVWGLFSTQIVLTVWHILCSYFFGDSLPHLPPNVMYGQRKF